MIRSKCFDIVIKELKPNIKATAQKSKRLTERNKQYGEKKMYGNNERPIYRSLWETFGNTHIAPDKRFLESIWYVEAKHNQRASWKKKKAKTEMGTVQLQEDLSTAVKGVWRVLKKFLKLESNRTRWNLRFLD